MKTAKYVIVAMGLVLLLSSCFMSNPWLSGGEGESVYLPPDVIKDVTRSGSDPFQFETLLPVALNLEIDFYESTAGLDKAALNEISAVAGQAVVIITNSRGDVVYEGAVQPDGSLNAQLVLPANPEDMTLTVKAYGFQDRSVVISDLVNYSKIDRKMGLMSEGLSDKELGDPEEWDRDGDLVPDIYDAFPDDADYAFVLNYPPEQDQYMTVAFEDLYLMEEAGDADYNDFLGKYRITERTKVNKLGQTMLTYIEGDIIAAVKIAGYDHLFGIAFGYKMETGEVIPDVDITLNYYGSDGNPPTRTTSTFKLAELMVPIEEPNDSPFTHKIVLPLFGSTAAATVNGNTPIAHFTGDFSPEGIDREKIQLAPYDPFLYVWNTRYDIHLIGEVPLSAIPDLPEIDPIYELKSGDAMGPYSFMDGEGFPWALLVPIDWEHPAETQRIETVYPFFDLWRQDEGKSNTDWYLRKIDPGDPKNDPPGEPALSPISLEFDSTNLAAQERYVDITLGADPNGDDPVTLHWSVPPAYITVAENGPGPESHKVIVDFPDDDPYFTPPEKLNIYFWCEDAEGAPSDFVPLSLSFVEASTSILVIETFVPWFTENDTYLTLFTVERDTDGNVIGSKILAEDDNGNPDQENHKGCSRIAIAGGLSTGTYYVKVHKPTSLGNPNYGIRILDYDPGTSFPSGTVGDPDYKDPANEIEDLATADTVDQSVSSAWVPVNPRTIALSTASDDWISRSIYLVGDPTGDVDCFEFTVP